jgi:four helix bundle protein
MQANKSKNLIVELTFQFALKIIKYTELLEKDKKFVLATQLLKAGTSIGANVREAQNAESKVDFIHKLKVAAKEADETEYWLLLCKNSSNFPDCQELIDDCTSIIKILSKIIATSKTSNRAIDNNNRTDSTELTNYQISKSPNRSL